jgi:glucose-6-phosphate dehydrogenase assembly protein OpcA
MNLVVIARRPEDGERAAETISRLAGRHPSRTLIVVSADPDGPSWLDASIRAHCVLPRPDAPETCSELILLTAGGETGRHLSALVAPLLIHDLPVTVWWPGEPLLEGAAARDLLAGTDRLVTDGAAWSGDGLGRLGRLAALYDGFGRLSVADFALVRQSRWREAIATVFDLPELRPFLWGIREIRVTYAARDADEAPGSTNVVKPLYHAAWLAARLGMRVATPLAPAGGELRATLRSGSTGVAVALQPLASPLPPGSTLRVGIRARRRAAELGVDVTAEAENVHVRARIDGTETLVRTFKAARRSDVDLLSEAIEVGGRDPLAVDTIRMAAALAGPAGGTSA